MNKNHEGYHDPTACEAIRRASRHEQKKKVDLKRGSLTYQIKEVPGFKKLME